MLAYFYSALLETQDRYGRVIVSTLPDRHLHATLRFPTRASYLNAHLQLAAIWTDVGSWAVV